MFIHLDCSDSPDRSYVFVAFSFMFQAIHVSLIHGRICAYVVVQLEELVSELYI